MRHDSDSLPYSQVHRSAKPKAALLACQMSVTYQHALGSLVEFWDLNGDRAELERILDTGAEAEVIINEAQARERWLLAAGKALEPTQLVHLRVLEQRQAGQYRVRGMWRYFEPLMKAKKLRDSARDGGRKSAETRKAKYGSSQPLPFGDGSNGASKGTSATVRSDVEPRPFEPGFEAQLEGSPKGPERAYSDQRTDLLGHHHQQGSVQTQATEASIKALWEKFSIVGWMPWKHTSRDRKAELRKRLKEIPEQAKWRAAAEQLSKSQYARGHNPKHWKANPDWFLKRGQIEKILDGKLDDHEPSPAAELLSDQFGVEGAALYVGLVKEPLHTAGAQYTELRLRRSVSSVEQQGDVVVVSVRESALIEEVLEQFSLEGVRFEAV